MDFKFKKSCVSATRKSEKTFIDMNSTNIKLNNEDDSTEMESEEQEQDWEDTYN